MIEHRAQHLDELTVSVGVALQLRANLAQRGRESPILERRAVAQGTGLLHQDWQIMPGIVDDLVVTELARMIGDDLLTQQHDDAFGMRTHQYHPSSSSRIDAVTIAIGRDQTRRAGPDCLLDKAVEGTTQLHQAGAFVLEHVPDRALFELRVFGAFGVGDALIFQPRIQLREALHAWLGAEQLVAQIADLVLDLALLPSRGRCAGHRLDEMMRAHLQEAAIVPPALADKDRLDRRLHVVVDAAPANAAIEPERLVVSVEHQLLGLAEVD